MIRPLVDLSGSVYSALIKPVFFAIPPDRIHERSLRMGEFLASTGVVAPVFNAIYNSQNPVLSQEIAGIRFDKPVGLAAGYDYTASLTNILFSIGFGFQTIGSITYGAYAGNTPHMYGRLPNSKSLWVNKGFKNAGAKAVAQKIQHLAFPLPVGISIGATNKEYASVRAAVSEYEQAFLVFEKVKNFTHYELNISCPNLHTDISFYQPHSLDELLKMVDALQLKRPVFIKMPVDVSTDQLITMLDVIIKHQVAGIIIGNLTKNRKNPAVWISEAARLPGYGGLSGKPVQALSDQHIRTAYRAVGDTLTIIGCGGVFNAHDAYRKIRLGASLVQLITGMIYQGPQIVAQINGDLATMLKRDGFANIREAVGVDA